MVAQGKNGEEKLVASDSGPLAIYVWKTTADPFVGKLTYFRIYSGSLQGDARIWNQTKGAEERMAGLILHARQGNHAGQGGSQRRYWHRCQVECQPPPVIP